MLFTCVPDIWQVLESNQNCSDNNKTKQPLTTTISPDPISDPIGAVLGYFGLLPLDISIAGCAGDVPAAAPPTQAAARNVAASNVVGMNWDGGPVGPLVGNQSPIHI